MIFRFWIWWGIQKFQKIDNQPIIVGKGISRTITTWSFTKLSLLRLVCSVRNSHRERSFCRLIVAAFKGNPEFKAESCELYVSCGAPTQIATPHVKDKRIGTIHGDSQWPRRESRINFSFVSVSSSF